MWRDTRRHTFDRVGAEPFEHFVGATPSGWCTRIGQGLTDDGPDAGLRDCRCNAVHVAQPVGDAGDAVQQELRTGCTHRGDVVLDSEALLTWYGVARPELSWPVVGKS